MYIMIYIYFVMYIKYKYIICIYSPKVKEIYKLNTLVFYLYKINIEYRYICKLCKYTLYTLTYTIYVTYSFLLCSMFIVDVVYVYELCIYFIIYDKNKRNRKRRLLKSLKKYDEKSLKNNI